MNDDQLEIITVIAVLAILAAFGVLFAMRQADITEHAMADIWQYRQDQAEFDKRWKGAVWLEFNKKTMKYAEVKP